MLYVFFFEHYSSNFVWHSHEVGVFQRDWKKLNSNSMPLRLNILIFSLFYDPPCLVKTHIFQTPCPHFVTETFFRKLPPQNTFNNSQADVVIQDKWTDLSLNRWVCQFIYVEKSEALMSHSNSQQNSEIQLSRVLVIWWVGLRCLLKWQERTDK